MESKLLRVSKDLLHEAEEGPEWSDIWQHFSKTAGGKARCLHCPRRVPAGDRMHDHIRGFHPHVWRRRKQELATAEDSNYASSSHHSDYEDIQEHSEGQVKETVTEILYLEDEKPYSDEKPCNQEKRKRWTEPVSELSSFINYIHCLMRQLPADVCSKMQMDIINIIVTAKLNCEQLNKSNGQNGVQEARPSVDSNEATTSVHN